MKRLLTLGILITAFAVSVAAQANYPSLYITPTDDGFEVYLTAAMHKKKVPVTVTKNQDGATYTLTAAEVEVAKVSTGAKVVSCLFAYCAGSEDKASTSVELIDDQQSVVWSYAVNKGRGAKNRQSMAEAIAKHLNDDFLKKRKATATR